METAQKDANWKGGEGVGVGFPVVSIQVCSVEL